MKLFYFCSFFCHVHCDFPVCILSKSVLFQTKKKIVFQSLQMKSCEIWYNVQWSNISILLFWNFIIWKGQNFKENGILHMIIMENYLKNFTFYSWISLNGIIISVVRRKFSSASMRSCWPNLSRSGKYLLNQNVIRLRFRYVPALS